MAEAFVDDDKIIIRCEHREREYIDAIGGAKWNGATDQWSLPLGLPAMYRIANSFPGIDVSKELADRATDMFVEQELARQFLDAPDDEIPIAHDSRLRPKQVAAVEFINMMGRALCTDEMGGGKTRHEPDMSEWLGKRAGVGKRPPYGFPKDYRFS